VVVWAFRAFQLASFIGRSSNGDRDRTRHAGSTRMCTSRLGVQRRSRKPRVVRPVTGHVVRERQDDRSTCWLPVRRAVDDYYILFLREHRIDYISRGSYFQGSSPSLPLFLPISLFFILPSVSSSQLIAAVAEHALPCYIYQVDCAAAYGADRGSLFNFITNGLLEYVFRL
jgi:hypothetical protein